MPNAINTDKLCMGCMSMLENENEPCPKCGYDMQKNVSAPHQLKPYTILSGKYLVGRVLGEGGFGITYLGWDLNLDIKIAIKEYYPAGLVTREITSTGTSTVTPFTGDKQEFYHTGLDKFVNEAKSLAKFYTLPGIVAVKDFFRENSTAYIVMEFVNGITLKQHLANSGGKLRPDEVFELMRPLMKSLSQIHAKGIIHRDISPDNIMLTNKGDVKLLDFGAARDFITDGNKSLSVLLKPGYAPEEQYRTKGHQGPWTDLYALCATIYKMITGITPPESLERFSEDTLVPPTRLGIELPKEVEGALLKGLAVFQKNRYQTIESIYNDIYQGLTDANIHIEEFSHTAETSKLKVDDKYRQKSEEKSKEYIDYSSQNSVNKPVTSLNSRYSLKKLLFIIAGCILCLVIYFNFKHIIGDSNKTEVAITSNKADNSKTILDVKIGEYVLFGKYNNFPIVWRIINKDDNGIMLISDKCISIKPFDGAKSGKHNSVGDKNTNPSIDFFGENEQKVGSNRWEFSNIRQWLNSKDALVDYKGFPPVASSIWTYSNNDIPNSYEKEPGFLYYFDENERVLINEGEIKNITNLLNNSNGATAGLAESATYDKVFLLSQEEWEKYVNNSTFNYGNTSYTEQIAVKKQSSEASCIYWLRTPNMQDTNCESVMGVFPNFTKGKSTVFDSYTPCSSWLAVRPALYLKKDVVFGGEGIENNPYKID